MFRDSFSRSLLGNLRRVDSFVFQAVQLTCCAPNTIPHRKNGVAESGNASCRMHADCPPHCPKAALKIFDKGARCDRVTRRCICGEKAAPLERVHWQPLSEPAGVHPLDELSEAMPELTASLSEELATTWTQLKALVGIECFIDAVAEHSVQGNGGGAALERFGSEVVCGAERNASRALL